MRNRSTEGDIHRSGVHRLGRAIRGLRRDRGLTLTQLSEDSGLSVAFLSQVENNRAQPSPQSLNAIANALNCTTVDIVGAARAGRVVDVERADNATPEDRCLGRISQVELTELHRPAGGGEDPQTHVHDAVLYVVRGRISVQTSDMSADGEHTLAAGDRIRCGGGVAYRWHALEDAVVVAARVDDDAPTPPD